MPWLIMLLAYLIGAIPTAYIFGRTFRGIDISRIGDANIGAANAFRQLGHTIGLMVFFIDTGKGMLAILLARAAGLSQTWVMLAGFAAIIGHTWSVFLGFRGGKGESTGIGVLLILVTQPMLILAAPTLITLYFTKNVIIASAVLFIPLSLVSWLLSVPGMLISYSIALPCLLGLIHYIKRRQLARVPS